MPPPIKTLSVALKCKGNKTLKIDFKQINAQFAFKYLLKTAFCDFLPENGIKNQFVTRVQPHSDLNGPALCPEVLE